jgi:hypothetical protein
MKELFEKQGQSIFTFKKGDIIIRLKPVVVKRDVYNDNLGILMTVDSHCDHSFTRNPVEFIGIENNLIYVRDVKSFFGDSKKVDKKPLSEYSEDWALFKVPDGLTLDDCISFI